MKIYRATLLLMLSYLLISCVGENSNNSTLIELHSPVFNRQITALNDTEWRALVQVNSGSTETFFFKGSTSPVSVAIAGIQRGEINDIFIKWYEVLHGHTVEMSTQSQMFLADGNTLVDTSHVHHEFDYDKDGLSNLVERFDGTCVWSSTESCLNLGQTDIPTDNAVLNGDFSDDNRYWLTDLTVVSDMSGEYCVNAPATAVEKWDARTDYSPHWLFIDANSSYTIEFDVRAQTSSEILFLMTARTLDIFNTLEQELVAVSTTYNRTSIRYESGENAYSEVSIGFVLGNGTDNTYCFDNIKLIKEPSL